MSGQNLWIINLILLCAVEANILCQTLQKRSIARGQPFQLPLYDQEMSDLLFWKLQKRARAYVEDGWLYVDEHKLNHAQLLRLFSCACF